ncbi:hypothetical protein EAI_05181 [Harpegnathos saltator]|uniref:Uncharacterized protein n=2 Tax=Harpegnathos saltator TaxID=610380 RepID=E2BQ44_HARSA|nr:hypothetical protein EAI_05181 [Harpegnathos saltator]
MRIFKTVLLIAYLGASVHCLPVGGKSTTESAVPPTVVPSTTEATTAAPLLSTQLDTNYYDQRQNGSENYRIHVDGVVLVFAPVEALLLAGATAAGTTASNSPTSEHDGPAPLKVGLAQLDAAQLAVAQLDSEKPNADLQNKTEPANSKTIHRSPLRVAHLLAPFLRRLHPNHSASVH